MQANDVRILRNAAIPTGAVGVIAALVSWMLAGYKGALGAGIGILVVMLFFTISLVAVTYAGRISPAMMAAAALTTYIVKIVGLGLLAASFADTTLWAPAALGWAVIAGTLVWTMAEAIGFMKSKRTILEGGPESLPEWARKAAQAKGAQYD
ncbi:hypothetical protein [Bailinhaonella thermotolerans]|uniref:hypothetical protein n=1 Tax=Bailinhaonella thermotolerans TaxID=1070861 RepID=UPI00192A3BD5|nr:hypothetical protein [Bailinhaonella thermotolerans]